MIPVLLIVIPLVTGLAAFFIKNEKAVRKAWALFSAIVTLVVSLLGITLFNEANLFATLSQPGCQR